MGLGGWPTGALGGSLWALLECPWGAVNGYGLSVSHSGVFMGHNVVSVGLCRSLWHVRGSPRVAVGRLRVTLGLYETPIGSLSGWGEGL